MLIELKSFIQKHSVVTMHDLLSAFDIGENNMRKILQNWIKRGFIASSGVVEPCCVRRKGCRACSLLALECYSFKA